MNASEVEVNKYYISKQWDIDGVPSVVFVDSFECGSPAAWDLIDDDYSTLWDWEKFTQISKDEANRIVKYYTGTPR